MEVYKNLSGRSGVVAYEITEDGIKVKFRGGHIYLYNSKRPGRIVVEKIIKLAVSGRGLNSYINRFVKKNFFSKK